MPRVRLLFVSLLAFSALSFAQKASDVSGSSSLLVQQPATALTLEAKSDSEPWRIASRDSMKSEAAEERIGHPEIGEDQDLTGKKKQFVWQSPKDKPRAFALTPDGLSSEDDTCFTIRSYVVARDNKNSDSTHPVGYSTCHPAKRYGLSKVRLIPATENR